MLNKYLQFVSLWLAGLVSGAPAGSVLVYFGTYTGSEMESKGIYASWFEPATGNLSNPFLVAEADNPSFLELHPNGKFLYAVSETSGAGKVSAYRINPKTGILTFLNEQLSEGEDPCHLSIDHTGKNLLVANYGSGSVALFPLTADGKLKEASGFAQHRGSSVNPRRQKSPHAHSVNISPDNQFAFVADLGTDKIMIYHLNTEKGTIKPNKPAFVQVEPGAGPRHLVFHPNDQHVYVINELNSTITTFDYQAEAGLLTETQTITTLPGKFKGNSTCAEIRIHPGGSFLYGSNRGHDSIALFRIDPVTGILTANGHMTEGIKTPRNFNIDPSGQYCLVANQDNDTVLVFQINQQDGSLLPTSSVIPLVKPVCVRFLEIKD